MNINGKNIQIKPFPFNTTPPMWAIKCYTGKEQIIVHQLFNKYYNLETSPNPIPFISAMSPVGHPGYIYIEADNVDQVKKAVEGMHLLFHHTLRVVPINERATVLEVPDAPAIRKKTKSKSKYSSRSIYNQQEEEEEVVSSSTQALESIAELSSKSFAIGDRIRIVTGRLKDLTGSIVSVESKRVTFRPDQEGFEAPIPIPIHMIERSFSIGDRVRITSGKHSGAVGAIASVPNDKTDNFEVLLDSSTLTVVSVTSSDIESFAVSSQISSHTPVTQQAKTIRSTRGKKNSKLDGYQQFDIISYNEQFGCIYDVGSVNLKVLTLNGVDLVVPVAANPVVIPPSPSCLDSHRVPVRLGDTVRVIVGDRSGLTGTVVAISKRIVFIESNVAVSGLVAIPQSQIQLQSQTQFHTTERPSRFKVQASHQLGKIAKSRYQRSSASRRPKRNLQDDRGLRKGQEVVIIAGPHKGCSASIVSIAPKFYKVEIPSKRKVLNIPKANISPRVDTGPTPTFEAVGGDDVGYTPITGYQTPAGGLATPVTFT